MEEAFRIQNACRRLSESLKDTEVGGKTDDNTFEENRNRNKYSGTGIIYIARKTIRTFLKVARRHMS